jgi:hypothetical protein
LQLTSAIADWFYQYSQRSCCKFTPYRFIRGSVLNLTETLVLQIYIT